MTSWFYNVGLGAENPTGVVPLSAAAYARVMKKLLPPGRIWRLEVAGILSRVFLGAGDELERVGGRAKDLIDESDPRTATELLPEFERELGLSSDGTDAERRARIVSHLVKRPRVRPADYQSTLASVLGLDPADVEVIEISAAEAASTGDSSEVYRFFIYRDPSLPGTYDVAEAQAIVDTISHSHTRGHVIESVAMICDDPESLCDRDIIGV
jgi:uncharacterized protein YmfQ (DUF2313 family)